MENDKVYIFLVGLNKDVDEVKGRILDRRPLPSLWEVFIEVRREKRRSYKVMLRDNNRPSTEGSTLVTKIDPYSSPRQPQ